MHRILSFSNWLSEASNFRDDWQDLPKWKLLKAMGFQIVSISPRNGTVTVRSPYSGQKDIRLTTSGYVRSSEQGYLFRTNASDPMPYLLDYLIERFGSKINLVPDQELDDLIKQDPSLLKALSKIPKLKEAVMKRTGVVDPMHEIYKQHGLTNSIVKWLDKCSNNTWALDISTGEINIQGDFKCAKNNSLGFRGVKFGEVGGYFSCDDIGLKSLDGCPRKVGGDFSCNSNQLTSLVGSPQEVNSFSCNQNNLRNLIGAPKIVTGSFACAGNPLDSLEGAPLEIGGMFSTSEFYLRKDQWNIKGGIEVLNGGNLNWKSDPQKATALIVTAHFMIPEVVADKFESLMEEDIIEISKILASMPQKLKEDVLKVLEERGISTNILKSVTKGVDFGLF
jgi:hypothetical protein